MTTRRTESGFTILEAVIIVINVAVLGTVSWFVYQHNATVPANTASHQTETQPPSDAYKGWKTYCDDLYHYCFKYPQDWAFTASTSATGTPKLGDTVGASVTDPTSSLAVTYQNPYTQDAGLMNFMTASLDKLTAANQDLVVVGGYIPTSGDTGLAGNNVPSYQVVDNLLLATYPLTVGKESQFPNNPRFDDLGSGSPPYTGRLKASPAVRINSLGETHAWFNESDTKTALLILKSISYQSKQ